MEVQIKPGYKQTEVGVIPDDWDVRKINLVADIVDGDRGKNYPSKQNLTSDGYCLFLNAGNVTKYGFSFLSCEFITQDKDASLSKGKLVRSDIVLTTRGTVGNFAYFDEDVVFKNIRINSGMVIIRRKLTNLNPRYLYLFLTSLLVSKQIEKLTFGSAQPQLTVRGINTLNTILPPTLEEQERIANALSDVDGLIEGLQRLIDKKKLMKQGAMQRLLNPYENGQLKEGWEVKRLGEVAEFINGRAYNLSEWETSGTPVIRLQNLTGRSNTFYYSNLKLPDKQYCINGDLLFMWSATFGPVFWKGGKAIYHYHIWKVEPINHTNKIYLFYVLNELTEYLKTNDSSGGTMLHVTKQKMELTKTYIPSSTEQEAIATTLSDMDAEIEALEQKLAKYRQIKQGMMQELLTGKTRLVEPSQGA